MDDPSPAVEPLPSPPFPESAAERSLVDDVKQLADDGRTFVQAELAFQASRARLAGSSVGGLAVYVGAGLLFGFFAFLALVVGLLIALTPLITAWGATGVVVLALLILAFVAARVAIGRWRRLRQVLAGERPRS